MVVIEKSPPNLVRVEGLLNRFPKHEIIVYNRNPYANCASILYRHHQPETKTEQERIDILRLLASRWVFRSKWAKKHIETYNPINFTYESFCQNPEKCINKVIERIPMLDGINTKKKLIVKNYEPQGIINQNKKQIGMLSETEKRAINEEIRYSEGLVNFFGYTCAWEDDVKKSGTGNVTSDLGL
jgi:hypothetical protein